ncbi:putative zinc finger [Lyophyllum shimeji]|uniref:Zinc finger n=1 Tax=Lyophyllum shimeji TaxID=47721 RepID=A0A9P3UQ15_LYOSH|nr:putative zinc finger [Lyophyllum shimeji]
MASPSVSEAQIKSEIARLTATINQHKAGISTNPEVSRISSRNNTYVNPNYKPPSKYVRPTSTAVQRPPVLPRPQVQPPSTEVKDVVLNGIAFESSGRSLVRKDLPKPTSSAPTIPRAKPQQKPPFTRKSGHLIPSSRVYKPKPSRGRRGRPRNRNMTLDNTTRSYQSRAKRLKYSDKPCPRFTTTGALSSGFKKLQISCFLKAASSLASKYMFTTLSLFHFLGSCSRGLTCPYQHDPLKIAICWNFLQGNCPNTEETCNLSHDPTPERTPLCLHFLNKGRCTRDNCPFPHVNVGARHGVCRDFAVLGYCERGLDCDKQHVRECPDFAENGTCTTKGCKLPHVIRANRTRKPTVKPADAPTLVEPSAPDGASVVTDLLEQQQAVHVTADDAQLGDEYISLTFNESESEISEEESEEDEDEEDDDEDDEGEEGASPTEVDMNVDLTFRKSHTLISPWSSPLRSRLQQCMLRFVALLNARTRCGWTDLQSMPQEQ